VDVFLQIRANTYKFMMNVNKYRFHRLGTEASPR